MSDATTEPAAVDVGEQAELDHQEFDDRDRQILDLERTWWKYEGAKATAIRERFDLSSNRYYARLNWIIDQPEAAEHDILTVKRLARLRAHRRRHRSARSRGIDIG